MIEKKDIRFRHDFSFMKTPKCERIEMVMKEGPFLSYDLIGELDSDLHHLGHNYGKSFKFMVPTGECVFRHFPSKDNVSYLKLEVDYIAYKYGDLRVYGRIVGRADDSVILERRGQEQLDALWESEREGVQWLPLSDSATDGLFEDN